MKGIICNKYRDKNELSIMNRHYDRFMAMNSIVILNKQPHPFDTGFGKSPVAIAIRVLAH